MLFLSIKVIFPASSTPTSKLRHSSSVMIFVDICKDNDTKRRFFCMLINVMYAYQREAYKYTLTIITEDI